MGNAFEEYREMRAIQIEVENDFDKKINKLIDSVGFMPTLVDFLKDFYEDHNGYYDAIWFVRSREEVGEIIDIGEALLRVSDNGYIDVLGLTSEEQEQLKKELPMYKFDRGFQNIGS